MMTPRQVLRLTRVVLEVVALLAIAFAILFAALDHPASGSTPGEPMKFDTPREQKYFLELLECEKQRDVANAKREGAEAKTATATAHCTATCPAIPPCPACTCSRDVVLDVIEIAGSAALGWGVGRAMCGPAVEVVR